MAENLGYVKFLLDNYVPDYLIAQIPDDVALLRLGASLGREFFHSHHANAGELTHSPAFTGQPWIPIHIKDGEKGPIVREVKAVQFFMRREGLPTRAHWLRY